MRVKTCFKNLKTSKFLDLRVKEEITKISEIYGKQLDVNVIFSKKSSGKFETNITLKDKKNKYHATNSNGNVLIALNESIGKVKNQLHKKRTKYKNRINKRNLTNPKRTGLLRMLNEEQYEGDHYHELDLVS